MHEIKKIKITGEIEKTARQMSDRMAEHVKMTGKGQYTGVVRPDEFYYGFVGELLFMELLKQERVHGVYRRKSALPEFLIYTRRGPIEVDVKTACQSFHRRIMLPRAQYDRYDTAFYVGARLMGTYGEIHGFCHKNEMMYEPEGFDDQKAPTMYQYLDKLHKISTLW